MDQPQRANAAQMAARNIKVARGKNMRRTGPVQKESPKPSWATPQIEAGLFGGNIQATGTFDFAAPSNFKFNSISSGPTMPNNLPNEAENGNGRFAGDDRNLKRMFGQSAAPQDRSITQTPNVFSASQPVSGFISEEVQNFSGTPNFNFQGGFNPVSFGQNTVAPAPPAKPLFSFGSTSQPATASNLTFGSNVTETSGDRIFNFGNQNNSLSTSNIHSQFGMPTSQAQPINSQLMFGQTSHPPQTSASSIFGTKTEKSSSSSLFGSQSINHTADKNSLPVSSAEPSRINNIFGNSQNTQPQNSIFNTDSSNSEVASISNLIPSKSSVTWGAPSSTSSNSFSAAFSMNGVQENLKQNSTVGGAMSGETQENTQSKNSILQPSAQPTSLTNVFSKQPSSSNIFAHLKVESSTLPKVSSPLKKFSLTHSQDSETPKSDASCSLIDLNPQKTANNQNLNTFSSGQNNFGSPITNDNIFGMKNNHKNDQSLLQALHKQSHLSVNNIFNQAIPKNMDNYEGGSASLLKENEENKINRTLDQNYSQPKENKDSPNIFAQPLSEGSSNSDKIKLSSNIFGQANLLQTESNVSTNSLASSPHLASKLNDKSLAPALSVSNSDKKLAVPMVQGEQPKALIEYRSAPQARKRNKFAPEVLPDNKSFRELALVSQIEEESIPTTLPSGSDEIDRQQFCATYRLRALNQAMAKMFSDLPIYSDPQPALNFFTEERKIILEECSKFNSKTKRKFECEDNEDQALNKKRKQSEIIDSAQISNSQAKDPLQSVRKRKLIEDEDQESQNSDKRNKNSQIQTTQLLSNDSKGFVEAEKKNSLTRKDFETNIERKKESEMSSHVNEDESEQKRNVNDNRIEKDVENCKPVNKSIFGDLSATPQSTRSNANIFSQYNNSRKSTATRSDDKFGASFNPQNMSAITSSSVGNMSRQESPIDNDIELTKSENEDSNNEKISEKKNINIFKEKEKPVKNTDSRIVTEINPFSSSTLNTDTTVSSETCKSPKSECEQSEIQIQDNNAKDDLCSKPRSIFDRVTHLPDFSSSSINSEKSKQQISKNIIFENKPLNSSKEVRDLPSDQTWKPETPIRFGATTVSELSPSMNATIKTSNEIGINIAKDGTFDEAIAKKPTHSSNSIFTNDKFVPDHSTNHNLPDNDMKINSLKDEVNSRASFPSLFGTSSADKSASTNVGFRFGQLSGNSLLSSAERLAETSKATSSGAEEIDLESKQDVGQDVAEENEQINLTATGPGEEDEDVIHEVRVKAQQLVSKEAEGSKKWEIKGIGPLRVLRHKNSGTSRLLLRGDPSGKIVLNKSILGNVTYKSSGKTLKFLCASDTGKEIETWILQVKTEEFAEKLASVLEDQKPKA